MIFNCLFFYANQGPNPGGPKGGGPKGGARRVGGSKGGARRVGARRVGARRVGARRVGPRRVGPRRVGPRRVGPRRVGPKPRKSGGPKGEGAQNFAFFFPLPPQNSFFSSLSGGLLVEFWWCLKRRDAQMCAFGVLWLSCASPGGPVWWGRRGFSRQTESPNVHI